MNSHVWRVIWVIICDMSCDLSCDMSCDMSCDVSCDMSCEISWSNYPQISFCWFTLYINQLKLSPEVDRDTLHFLLPRSETDTRCANCFIFNFLSNHLMDLNQILNLSSGGPSKLVAKSNLNVFQEVDFCCMWKEIMF